VAPHSGLRVDVEGAAEHIRPLGGCAVSSRPQSQKVGCRRAWRRAGGGLGPRSLAFLRFFEGSSGAIFQGGQPAQSVLVRQLEFLP